MDSLDRVGAVLRAYDTARTEYQARTMHLALLMSSGTSPATALPTALACSKVPAGD
jgi:hypothetical protein